MKYPSLINKAFCKTDIEITLHQEGLTEDGEPATAFKGSFKCNYQEGAKAVYTADKKQVKLNGIAYIPNDIAPNLPTLSGGIAVVYGVQRTIHTATKARNPDGSVNYCKLELI
ncbi:MAG: hypothetical protein UE295_06260 [Acutalibacteraceae bacterium]|nr:hypothetical protein [Acutalibacteraceae bacterium]